jgi:hypothetical protein
MAYTPQLSYRSSCTLRRLAWALDVPMTEAMERVFEHLPVILDRQKICGKCRDHTRCEDCAFNNSKGGSS